MPGLLQWLQLPLAAQGWLGCHCDRICCMQALSVPCRTMSQRYEQASKVKIVSLDTCSDIDRQCAIRRLTAGKCFDRQAYAARVVAMSQWTLIPSSIAAPAVQDGSTVMYRSSADVVDTISCSIQTHDMQTHCVNAARTKATSGFAQHRMLTGRNVTSSSTHVLLICAHRAEPQQ